MSEELYYFLKAADSFSDERAFLFKLSLSCRLITCTGVIASLFVGWMSKMYIYRHIFETRIRDQPINLLLLAEQVVNHICGSFVLLAFLSYVTFNVPAGNNTIKTFCRNFYHIKSELYSSGHRIKLIHNAFLLGSLAPSCCVHLLCGIELWTTQLRCTVHSSHYDVQFKML